MHRQGYQQKAYTLLSCTCYELSVMNKVLLITGGSRGIGAATACLAAADGYDVCISYRQNRTAADSVVRSIEQQGRSAIGSRCRYCFRR